MPFLPLNPLKGTLSCETKQYLFPTHKQSGPIFILLFIPKKGMAQIWHQVDRS